MQRLSAACNRNSIRVLLFILGLTAPIFIAVRDARAEIFQGHVIHVTNGDTITVLNGKEHLRVRISGIDAPERRQSFAKESQEHLSKLVRRQIVTVNWYKKDPYGRRVGTVLVNGIDAGLEQIRAGLAWHYKCFEGEQTPEDRARYTKAESDARAKRIGLWQDTDPVPPWAWRNSKQLPK